MAAAIAAFIYPPAFLIFKDYFLYCFAATMLALGIVLKPEEARSALNRPSTIALGVSAYTGENATEGALKKFIELRRP